jgi:hypothetical protein
MTLRYVRTTKFQNDGDSYPFGVAIRDFNRDNQQNLTITRSRNLISIMI